MSVSRMGAVFTRLQRILPVLKEQMKTIEVLQNQEAINAQKIEILESQKAMLEQNVVTLSAELSTAHLLIEELRVNSKRFIIFSGVFALGAWLYIRKLDRDLLDHDDVEDDNDDGCDDQDDDYESLMIPESVECIVCMERAREVMMEPCGHVCICRACADRMRLPGGRVKCPVCRIRAETRTVFLT